MLIVGAWIGAFFGGLLFHGFLQKLSKENPLLGLYLTILFCSIVVAAFGMIFFDYSIIIGSSCGGSYLFIRVSVLDKK